MHTATHFVREAAEELFGRDVFSKKEVDNPNIVRVPLPCFWADAAQPVIDLLIRGYGLTSESRVEFHFSEKA